MKALETLYQYLKLRALLKSDIKRVHLFIPSFFLFISLESKGSLNI